MTCFGTSNPFLKEMACISVSLCELDKKNLVMCIASSSNILKLQYNLRKDLNRINYKKVNSFKFMYFIEHHYLTWTVNCLYYYTLNAHQTGLKTQTRHSDWVRKKSVKVEWARLDSGRSFVCFSTANTVQSHVDIWHMHYCPSDHSVNISFFTLSSCTFSMIVRFWKEASISTECWCTEW